MRSAVKSCSTWTAPLVKAMIAIRSASVICVFDEFLGGVERAQLIGHRHRGEIEVERQQTAIAVTDVAGRFRARSACG